MRYFRVDASLKKGQKKGGRNRLSLPADTCNLSFTAHCRTRLSRLPGWAAERGRGPGRCRAKCDRWVSLDPHPPPPVGHFSVRRPESGAKAARSRARQRRTARQCRGASGASFEYVNRGKMTMVFFFSLLQVSLRGSAIFTACPRKSGKKVTKKK